MRIGIDMRMAGTGEGIGRYIAEVAKGLTTIDKKNQYFLFYNERGKKLFINLYIFYFND